MTYSVGDRVILINSDNVFTLELYHSYEIAEMQDRWYLASTPNTLFMRMVNDDMFYNSTRFTKDIRYVRRKKIKELNW